MLLGHRPGTTSESSHITVSHAPFRPVLSPAPRPVSMSSRKKIIFPAPDAFVFLSSQNRRCGAAPPATHILIEKAVACRALRHRPAAEAILSLPCPQSRSGSRRSPAPTKRFRRSLPQANRHARLSRASPRRGDQWSPASPASYRTPFRFYVPKSNQTDRREEPPCPCRFL